MPGPDGIITVYGSFRKVKECEEGEATFAEAVFFGEEFKEIHAATDPAEMPASKQEVSASLPPSSLQLIQSRWNLSLAMPPRPPRLGKICPLNRKARLSSSSVRTRTSSHGSHLT
jgi:hypothetical protein